MNIIIYASVCCYYGSYWDYQGLCTKQTSRVSRKASDSYRPFPGLQKGLRSHNSDKPGEVEGFRVRGAGSDGMTRAVDESQALNPETLNPKTLSPKPFYSRPRTQQPGPQHHSLTVRRASTLRSL